MFDKLKSNLMIITGIQIFSLSIEAFISKSTDLYSSMFDDMGAVRVEVIQGTHGHNLKHSKTCSV
jgi:hypothetical protein